MKKAIAGVCVVFLLSCVFGTYAMEDEESKTPVAKTEANVKERRSKRMNAKASMYTASAQSKEALLFAIEQRDEDILSLFVAQREDWKKLHRHKKRSRHTSSSHTSSRSKKHTASSGPCVIKTTDTTDATEKKNNE